MHLRDPLVDVLDIGAEAITAIGLIAARKHTSSTTTEIPPTLPSDHGNAGAAGQPAAL